MNTSSSKQLCVSCLSLISPIGTTPESAAATMRAGIAAFRDLPFVDNSGEPIVGATVPGLPDDLRGRARLSELLTQAFEAIDESLPRSLTLTNLPLIFCTSESVRPGARADRVIAEMQELFNFRHDSSYHVAHGAVSTFEALRQADQLLDRGGVHACLIAAVDTLIDARTLNWLDNTGRLKMSERTDGVIGGEAACVSIVSMDAITPCPIVVRGLGFAVETATVLDDKPLLGKGMTAAVKGALDQANLAMHEVDFRLSDVGGESYAFEELVLAQTRLTRIPRKSQDVWHPADCMGDCGAAAGLIELAWAEQAFSRAYAPGPIAIIHASSTSGERAAAIITAAETNK